MTLSEFIIKRRYLVWYVRDPGKLSKEAVVEAVLNYGNWEDVQQMIQIIGMKQVAQMFKKEANRPRCNYKPDIKHYFTLYFKRYA